VLPASWSCPQHLVVRQDLTREPASEQEQLAEERRFVDPGEKEDVASQGRFNQTVYDVLPPPQLARNQAGCPRIGSEEKVLVQVPAERISHFGKRPVRNAQNLEPTRETVRKPPLHQRRCGTEEQDLDGSRLPRVLVPEPLDDLRPLGDLLDLVQDQNHAAPPRGSGQHPGALPLCFDPRGILQGRFVGGRVVGRGIQLLDGLKRQRGLSRLTRAGEHLDETARSAESRGEAPIERGSAKAGLYHLLS
jgi:hypothetical protein